MSSVQVRQPGSLQRARSSRARLRGALVLLLLLVGPGLVGCAKLSLPGMRRTQSALTHEELREELVAFSSRFASVVSRAGDLIRAESTDPLIRMRVLLWEMRLVPLVQEGAFVPDAQEAFVAVNSLVVMMRRYLTEGDGREVFGPQQPIAVEAAAELEEDFYGIARLFLSEEEVVRLRVEVDAEVASRLISGSDFTIANVQRQSRAVRESGRFDWVVAVPMSPFRALEGVGSGAAAIHDFNDTALRFSRIVEGLPQQLRLQTALMLYDVESREGVVQALAALESFAESAQRLAALAEELPTDLEALLGNSEGALAEANRTLLMAQGMVEPLRATALQLNLAGASWGAIFERDGEPDPDARPFDIREYEATARGIGEAAVELSALAGKLDQLIESPGLEAALGSVDATVSRVESGGQGVVDHAAWRGLQLLLAGFALLLIYRLVSSRLSAPTR
ncbi:MAG: hypothetical protein ABFS46_14870 [Myxococcota bacterium]